MLRSHYDLFFDSFKEYYLYKFEQNEKQTWSNNSGFIGSYFFWIQNNAIIYERNYKRIQNILVGFGGITRSNSIILYYLNWFIYKFILLKDINYILFNMIKDEIKNSSINKIFYLDFDDHSTILGFNNLNISKNTNDNINIFKNGVIDNKIKKK